MTHEQAAQLKYLVKELIFSTVWAEHDQTSKSATEAELTQSKVFAYIDSLITSSSGSNS